MAGETQAGFADQSRTRQAAKQQCNPATHQASCYLRVPKRRPASLPVRRRFSDDDAASVTTIRRRLIRSTLLLGSITFTLLILEGASRVYASLTHQERGMAFDPELGWRPIPNVRKLGGVWGATRPASTNSYGWRDVERTYAKAAGMRRAVAIGDSFTFGVDADDGDRFTDVLPRLIERLEVVNLGVAGYGTDQELRVLETEAFRYDPDVLILTICVSNDLDDIGYERLYSWPKPTYSLAGGELQLMRPRLTWDIRVRNTSYLVEFLFQRFRRERDGPRRTPGFRPSDAPALFDALIRRMASEADRRSVSMVAVMAYLPERVDRGSHQAAGHIVASLDRAGIPRLDVRELFAGRTANPEQELFSPVGNHWNPRGNEIVAHGLRGLLAGAGVE